MNSLIPALLRMNRALHGQDLPKVDPGRASRAVWRVEHVVNVRDAGFAARNYIEHQDLRRLLSTLAVPRTGVACEVGAGYGRMAVVLTEFFDHVVAFEREPHFVEEGERLYPAIRFQQVQTLARLPAGDGQFDFILTFTVLQHLTDPVVADVAQEISRVLRPGGHLLVCELTDPSQTQGAIHDPDGMCVIGRPIEDYELLFRGLQPRSRVPRRVEPTCPETDVGTYMLFAK
jgi:SAM-dependent methyltransferase